MCHSDYPPVASGHNPYLAIKLHCRGTCRCCLCPIHDVFESWPGVCCTDNLAPRSDISGTYQRTYTSAVDMSTQV